MRTADPTPNGRRGSALLLVLVLGTVLLLGLAALVGTAVTEHRNSERTFLASAAFALAEAGVDRTTRTILDDTFAADASPWRTVGGNYVRTFTADTAALGGRRGGYQVVVARSGTVYTVSSKGWVENVGASTRSERAVEVVFDRRLAPAGAAQGAGCIALDQFLAGSTADAAISTSQVGPTFDSYSSENNAEPSALNRSNKTLVGTLSAADGALNLSNGSYFCTVGTGSSTGNATPAVKTAKNASPPYETLTKLDDPTDTVENPVAYNPGLVRHDLSITVDPVIPPDAPEKEGWVHTLPKDGSSQQQFKSSGKLSDFDRASHKKETTAARDGNTFSIGATDADKNYVAVSDLGNINKIDVTGTVILVVAHQPINASNGITVNFRSPNAKLILYAGSGLSGVLKTTQQIGSAVTPNWEAKRLTVAMLPGNHKINMQSLEPTAINAHVTTAAQNPTAGGTITMNFDDRSTFVGQIVAPYSTAQLSATGQKGKMSDYCGSLLAKTISITGSNGFAFHYDQHANAAGGGATTPTLVRTTWRQLLANDPVFD